MRVKLFLIITIALLAFICAHPGKRNKYEMRIYGFNSVNLNPSEVGLTEDDLRTLEKKELVFKMLNHLSAELLDINQQSDGYVPFLNSLNELGNNFNIVNTENLLKQMKEYSQKNIVTEKIEKLLTLLANIRKTVQSRHQRGYRPQFENPNVLPLGGNIPTIQTFNVTNDNITQPEFPVPGPVPHHGPFKPKGKRHQRKPNAFLNGLEPGPCKSGEVYFYGDCFTKGDLEALYDAGAFVLTVIVIAIVVSLLVCIIRVCKKRRHFLQTAAGVTEVPCGRMNRRMVIQQLDNRIQVNHTSTNATLNEINGKLDYLFTHLNIQPPRTQVNTFPAENQREIQSVPSNSQVKPINFTLHPPKLVKQPTSFMMNNNVKRNEPVSPFMYPTFSNNTVNYGLSRQTENNSSLPKMFDLNSNLRDPLMNNNKQYDDFDSKRYM